MDSVVCLSVKIGIDSRGRHKYPPFNTISAGRRGGMDWAHFVDSYGGWIYDRTSGHRDTADHSPKGVWIGLLTVPSSFAESAVEQFPNECDILTDSEAEEFYEQFVTISEPEIEYDLEALQLIAAKRAAGIGPDDDDADAIDVDNAKPGRRRNGTKQWSGYKQSKSLQVDRSESQRLKRYSAERRQRG